MIKDFLEKYRPGGPWVLTAIIPDGKTETRTFTQAEDAAAWVKAENKRKNIYFQVNPTTKSVKKKSNKEDIASVEYLHVDVDPRVGEDFNEERERILKSLTEDLPKDIPAPTLIIDSGGGYQAFWRLNEPLELNGDSEKIAKAEAYNRELANRLGGDSCHNIDRIMRLPYTTNWPNKKKQAKGREPREAEVYSWNDVGYPITAFKPAPITTGASISQSYATGKARAAITLGGGMPMGTEELRQWAEANGKRIHDATLARIATGKDPIDPDKYPSRSEALFAVCCELVRADVDDETIYRVITGPNEIAASVKDKPNPQNYAIEQIQKARAAVGELPPMVSGFLGGGYTPNWFPTNKEGLPVASFHNIVEALQTLGIEFRFDEFRQQKVIGIHYMKDYSGPLTDRAEVVLRREIRQRFGFDPKKEPLHDAITELCEVNHFDSLVDHINSIPSWDGVPRLDTWLIDYCGAESSPFVREAGAAWLTAAVVRAFEPGAKFDYMLVLIGGQGVGKSTALRILAGDEFFSDASFLSTRDAREVLELSNGVWIQECAELDGISKKDVSALKAMIARQDDTGRPAYARNVMTVPRRFVLGGTTNERRFLQDPTGNRRFWPVEVGQIDLKGLADARDQLFAEALAQYRSGDYRLWLTEDAEALARKTQGERMVVDGGFFEMLEFLEAEGEYKGQRYVTNEHVYSVLGLFKRDRTGIVTHKVRAAMEALGWMASKNAVRLGGKLQRIFVWEGEGEPPEIECQEIESNPF